MVAFQSVDKRRMQRGLWRELHSGVKEDESIEYFGEESPSSAEAPIGEKSESFQGM